MKLLSIIDNRGLFLAADGTFEPLDKIGKEDLLRLVNLVLTTNAEMDGFDASLLQNQAHQIIYQNLWTKLVELAARKTEFLDESKRLFLTEHERYKASELSIPTDSASNAASTDE
jgi:hypothetical protein